jgi:hypothetical protein
MNARERALQAVLRASWWGLVLVGVVVVVVVGVPAGVSVPPLGGCCGEA